MHVPGTTNFHTMFNIALDPASPVMFAGAILVPLTLSIQGLRMITAAVQDSQNNRTIRHPGREERK